jgi:hypothetical protein
VITPINIALLGVVLAAVALVILRRRHSGATDEALVGETPDADADEAPAFNKHAWAQPAAALTPVHEDEAVTVDTQADADEVPAFNKHAWAEAVATLTPVHEDEAVTVETDADADDADDEADGQDDAQEADDDAEDFDFDADGGDEGQDTGEIHELEAMTGPDDGLGDIITEPGWYLPGETDMTRGSPSASAGLLAPDDDFQLSGGELDEDLGPAAAAAASPLLGEDADGFGDPAGWAAAEENGAPEAAPTWLGLADEEGAAAAAVPAEHEISFEAAPTPSDDLFALPPLAEGLADEPNDLAPPSLSLDQWQDPATPSPSSALGAPPADLTVAQHGPLTVSIDPAALLAIETERVERSTSQGGEMSWELTLKVQLRQRPNAPDEAD